jgi:hypothetical protein
MTDTFLFNDLGSCELSDAARAKLQCNILTSTGRPQAKQIFRRFDTAKDLATWLVEQKPPPPSTANEAEPEVVTILFTKRGLERLGVEDSILQAMDGAFQRGPRHEDTIKKLPDTKPSDWGDHEEPWDVVELRGHDFNHPFKPPADSSYLMEHGTGLDENGQPLQERRMPSHGHFGILDGISKLVYTDAEYAALKVKPPAGQAWKFDPRQKLSSLLVRDPLAMSSDAFGSYFVFRKYKQYRDRFEAAIDSMIQEIVERDAEPDERGILSPADIFPALRPHLDRLEGQAHDVIRADPELRNEVILLIFGRDRNGNTASGNTSNDFNYRDGGPQSECPFHAHVSKMNPRGRTGDLEFERSRAIARRGTSYVRTTVAANGRLTHKDETGLLFWCAQASIGEQFEYIMEKWANSSSSGSEHEPTPDVDTVIGHIDLLDDSSKVWRNWKATTHLNCGVWQAVELVGAEYLYAPSLEGFAELQARAKVIMGAQS